MPRIAATVVLCLSFAGCSDSLEFQSFEGDVRLSYSCSEFVPVASAQSEFDLLEEMAMTAYSNAMSRAASSEASHLPALRHDRQYQELEREVVKYFCANPSAIETERAQIVRYPIRKDSVAPDFNLPVLVQDDRGRISEGEKLRLSSLRGKVVVLHMFAVWCGPCRTEHQDLIDYQPKVPAGVEILTIVTKSTPGLATEWLSQNGGMTFTTLIDHGDRMANRYGIASFPQLYVIGTDGRVAFHRIGPTSMDELGPVLSALAQSHQETATLATASGRAGLAAR